MSLNTLNLPAQTTSVKGTKTDKTFANTTEIYKSKVATDAQVLAELERDFGISDVVRISDAPPVSTTVPLSKTTSIQLEKKPLPSIPKTENATNAAISIEKIPTVNKEIATKTASTPIAPNTNKSRSATTPPLSQQALVITSGSYKSDIEMPEKKGVSEENAPKATESVVERKTKAYTPPSVKSSKSAKSYKKSSSSGKRFLFFFKKTSNKSPKRSKYKDNNKFGCYKF